MIISADELYAFFVGGSPEHWAVTGRIELLGRAEKLVVSPFVIVELEARVRERFGLEGWCAVLEQLGSGAWSIPAIDAEHLEAMGAHVAAGLTLARASVAVLVARADS